MSEDDPLQDVLVNKDEIDRERLSEGIDGIIGVDEETGEPAPLSGYHDLGNKQKFVARLLARRAALALDLIEESELGDSSSEFADQMSISTSTVQNYSSIPFVENDDEYGGYYVPAYAIEEAIEFIHDGSEDE